MKNKQIIDPTEIYCEDEIRGWRLGVVLVVMVLLLGIIGKFDRDFEVWEAQDTQMILDNNLR